ncbi:MAG: class I SAM-dependent methyltransferase [Gammaproteobacteria bacterium]|nr:class I SAM-dependent methyltransferase [Pseudomonadales bacterium]MCP5347728.1 class I SAM-dependent methyltransferase [Pseudomonadales bacterium]
MNRVKETVATFDKYADQYLDRFRQYEPYLSTFAAFAELMRPQHQSVLDVGCGPGIFCNYLANRFTGLKITGIDLAPAMLELARQTVTSGEFILLDCREMSSVQGNFDVILLAFCLPYLNREEAVNLLAAAAGKLNEGGLLYLSTMEGDYTKSGCQTNSSGDRVHTYYYQSDMLADQLNALDLEIVKLDRKLFTGENEKPVQDLFFFARRVS